MNTYTRLLEVRWADLDPNFHVRHSVYYDWGAFCRMSFFTEQGLSVAVLQEHNFGPILFREECQFRKEIKFGDSISMDMKLLKARSDYARWSIQHQIYINGDAVAAILTVDGAFIDTSLRKLTIPPPVAFTVFSEIPLSDSFEWTNK
ncbi:MAG: acyl-CoA thioesterase [Chitinophagaceae bacterium]